MTRPQTLAAIILAAALLFAAGWVPTQGGQETLFSDLLATLPTKQERGVVGGLEDLK